MPVVIENRATAFEFTNAATIQPSNFEAISFAVFNNTCEIEVWNMPQGSFQQGDWGGVLLTAPGQVTLNRCGGVRFRCARTNGLAITAVTQSPGAVTVAGDATTAFQAGFAAVIHGSTGNDGSYVVASAAVSGTNTVITFTTNLPSATANGFLYACAQIIAYAWKDDEVQIASTTASSGNLAGSGFSPFSAAGIQFNHGTYGPVNIGDWLDIRTTAFGGNFNTGINIEASDGGFQLQTDDTGSGIAFMQFNVVSTNGDGFNVDTSGVGNGGANFNIRDDDNNGFNVFVQGTDNGGILLIQSDGGGGTGIVLRQQGPDGIQLTDNGGGGLTLTESAASSALLIHNTGAGTGSLTIKNTGTGGILIEQVLAAPITIQNDSSSDIDITAVLGGIELQSDTKGILLLCVKPLILEATGGTTEVTIQARVSSGNFFAVTDLTPTTRFSVRADGRVNMPSLPTSAAGLASGDLWNNSNVVNIV